LCVDGVEIKIIEVVKKVVVSMIEIVIKRKSEVVVENDAGDHGVDLEVKLVCVLIRRLLYIYLVCFKSGGIIK